MSATPGAQGFSLIEVLIAMAILSVISLAVSTTLIGAQRARGTSERWMQALQLAAEGIEQVRAGHALGAVRIAGAFKRSGRVTPWRDHPGLYQLEVTVSWDDPQPHALQLVTLARR